MDRFQGLGMRVEDDILVTEDGCVVMTEAVPKEVDAIESLLSN